MSAFSFSLDYLNSASKFQPKINSQQSKHLTKQNQTNDQKAQLYRLKHDPTLPQIDEPLD